jgi:transposase InsO family protein
MDPDPWKTIEQLESATLAWVHWHNIEWLHGYLGDVPPAEFEAAFCAGADQPKGWAGIT